MMRKVIKMICLLLWLIIIFYFSNQSGDVSQNISDNLLGKSYGFFFNFIPLDYQNFILKYGYYFRKLAHFSEYLILAIIFYLNIIEYTNNKHFIITLLFCLISAILDEIHQLFIIDRAFRIFDIFVDFLGSLFGTLFISLIRNKWKRNI